MKTISYIFGILVILVSFSSCTAEELALWNNSNVTPATQEDYNSNFKDIDPPMPIPKP